MNSNYPRNLSSFFLLFFLIFKRKHIHLHVYSSNRSNFNFQHHRRITIETFRSERLENLIRHRLRSPLPPLPTILLPGKKLHRRRENKFHAPKNRKQAGADRGNTFFPSAIPLAATRPVQPGVVKYKLPDRLGQTRSDNRSLAREGREPATLNFQRIFHPPPVCTGAENSRPYSRRVPRRLFLPPWPSSFSSSLPLSLLRVSRHARASQYFAATRVEASRAPTVRKRKKEEEEEEMEEEEEVYLYPVGLGTDVSIGALFYKYLSSFESIGKFFLCLSP